jgi:hypothetical protein
MAHRCALPALVLAFVLSGVAPAGAYVSQLKRYPYLTDTVNGGAAGYATVNWATDRSASTGSVLWGEVGSDDICVPTTTVTATRTSISVSGVSEYQWKAQLVLGAGRHYCYRVRLGSVDLLGVEPSPRFWTQVPSGSPERFSFAVFGDWGYTDSSGANPHQANVMRQIAASGARFAVTTGDQPYGSGSQSNYGDLVQRGSELGTIFGPQSWTVPGASIPLFPALGNHGRTSTFLANWPQERAVDASGGRYAMETYCCLNGTTAKDYPSAWYAFDAGGTRIYVLDSSWSSSNSGTADSYKNDYDYHWARTAAEYQWLENDLRTHPSELKFAFFHFPMYSDNATEKSNVYLQGAESLEGLLSRYGVDIGFSGHAHMYQRNRKPHDASLITYLTGGGGATLQPIGAKGCSAIDAYGIGWSNSSSTGSACGSAVRPTTIDRVYHFLLVTVEGTQVTVTPIDELGRRFDEVTYAFAQTPDTEPPTVPTGLIATAPRSDRVDLTWTPSTDDVGVTGYRVERRLTGAADWTTLATPPAPPYADTTVAASTSYDYRVTALDASGRASAPTAPETVTTPAAPPPPSSFAPVADAYVEEAAPAANFGTATRLLSDGSPRREVYLRFTVQGITRPVKSARLRLFASDGSSNGPELYRTTSGWSESSLVWTGRPSASGGILDDEAGLSSSTWIEYDVSSVVTGDGSFDFLLRSSSGDGTDLHSREASANRPELVITQG